VMKPSRGTFSVRIKSYVRGTRMPVYALLQKIAAGVPTARLRFGGVSAVAAISAINVWAVGVGPGVPTGGFSAHPTALVEHWDGTRWSVVASPNPNRRAITPCL
jgi:hypothetical protein